MPDLPLSLDKLAADQIAELLALMNLAGVRGWQGAPHRPAPGPRRTKA